MLIDSRQLPDGHRLAADICIIGAGPAGIVLADQLAKTGLRIILAEAGGLSSKDEDNTRSLAEQLGYSVIIHPRTRCFGGMSNAWGGLRGLHVRLLPLDPIDFEKRSWVPNSGWPISYEVLRPFYRRAFDLFGGIPQKNAETKRHEHRFLPVFNDDVLRSGLIHLAPPIRFGERYRTSLEQAPNVQVLLNCRATEIEENRSDSRISLIHAVAGNGRKLRLAGQTFLLTCGGLETTRLLLASRQKHPSGIGNQHDLVGRYYMQHPKGSHGHVVFRRSHGPGAYVRGFRVDGHLVQACVSLSERQQRQGGLLNHRIALAPILELSESRASRLHGELRAAWREGHRSRAFRRGALAAIAGMPGATASICGNILRSLPEGSLHYRVVNHMEQAPDPTSRIELADEPDRLGMPRLRTNWRINTDEKRSLCRLHEFLDRNLRRYKMGCCLSNLHPDMPDWPIAASSSHDLGTARMHDNPRQGVTDADGRVHGIPNLYITGGALFPTSGHANPTLTIIALALHLADRLSDRTRRTPIVSLSEKLPA